MGLLFAIQPDLRRSTPDKLVLRSTKRRFGLGGGFLFGAALLGTMFLAASPLFKVLWNEGGYFDKFITLFFYVPIFLYPVVAFVCWFFEEVVLLQRRPDGLFDLEAYEKVLGFRWNRRALSALSPASLSVENWKGAVNTASIEAQKRGKTDRYATQGHWILKARPPAEGLMVERRAKREEVELLKAQIEGFMKGPESLNTNA
jgi:hypothetical protein